MTKFERNVFVRRGTRMRLSLDELVSRTEPLWHELMALIQTPSHENVVALVRWQVSYSGSVERASNFHDLVTDFRAQVEESLGRRGIIDEASPLRAYREGLGSA